MTQGIYAIINGIHCGIYFGSSKNIELRWRDHIYYLSRGEHHNKYLQRAWDKYGANAFYFEVVEIVEDVEELFAREQRWIDVGYYNLAPIAGPPPNQLGRASPRKGIPLDEVKPGWCDALKAAFTEERRKSLSDLRKANPEWHANWVRACQSEEARAKSNEKNAARSRTPERRKAVGEWSKAHPEYVAKATAASAIANKGRKRSQQTKDRISAGLLAYHDRKKLEKSNAGND